MNCITCGHRSGYNRAVIDLYSGVEIGRLCMNCEKDEFGRTLQHGFHTDGDDCQLCERDGQIALPRYVPKTVIENGVVKSTTVLEEGNAPRLCDEHFHMIVEGVDVEPVIRP